MKKIIMGMVVGMLLVSCAKTAAPTDTVGPTGDAPTTETPAAPTE